MVGGMNEKGDWEGDSRFADCDEGWSVILRRGL